MAVIKFLPGIEITVCVDGKSLEEFENPNSRETEILFSNGGKTLVVSKYIESTTNQEFGVRWTVGSSYKPDCEGLQFATLIDGKELASNVYRCYKETPASFPWSRLQEGLKTGPGKLIAFKFSEIKTTSHAVDRTALVKDARTMSGIGQIIVEVNRRKDFRKGGPRYYATHTINKIPSEVHEESLKGQVKSHGVVLGVEKDGPENTWFSSKDMDAFPIAKFIFKYCSKESLKQLHIIERTPEPEPDPEPEPEPALNLVALLDEAPTPGAVFQADATPPANTPFATNQKDPQPGDSMSDDAIQSRVWDLIAGVRAPSRASTSSIATTATIKHQSDAPKNQNNLGARIKEEQDPGIGSGTTTTIKRERESGEVSRAPRKKFKKYKAKVIIDLTSDSGDEAVHLIDG